MTFSPVPPPGITPPHSASHRWAWGLLLAILTIALCNGFAIWYVLNEHIIYHFDSIGYWIMLTDLKHNFATEPWNAFYWIWLGVRMDDYSSITVAPLLPFTLFGTTRIWYILSIVNTYALPAICAFYFLVKRFFTLARPPLPGVSSTFRPLDTIIIVATILLAPTFWAAIVGGMPDVAGIALTALILLVTIGNLPELRWRDECTIGILAFALVRFRRWYLIWLAGYFLARGVIMLYCLASKRQWKPFFVQCTKLALCVVICGALLYVISGPFILGALKNDYSSMYAGFQIIDFSWWKAVHIVLGYFGYLIVALSLCGMFLSLRYKRLRMIAAFLIIQLVTSFVLFARTQTFFSHHWYLLLTTILLFADYFLLELTQRSTRFRIAAIGLILLMILTFLSVYYPPVTARTYKLEPLVPTPYNFLVRTRGDLEEMQRLHWTLYDITGNPSSRVYLLSSAAILNFAMLRYMHFTFPAQPNIADRILVTQDLDLLNGFPNHLFEASHIVVAEPIQYMSSPEQSRILILPAERLLTNQGLGQAFHRLPYQFKLDGGVTAFIFERTRKITQAEAQELSDALRSFYPKNPTVYTIAVPPGTLSE